MTDWKTVDFFADQSLVEDPYPYFDDLRAAGPVVTLPPLGVVAVTGYDEACEVYRDTDCFSSCNSPFLFAAGQETTARLLASALKHLAEHPELQDELQENRERIPDFLEEVLRVESPVKADFRLARRSTTVGGVDVPAGTPVMLLNGAANRDPRRFECPADVRIDRPNAQAHIAFGRGAHSCPGGPLARAEGRVSLERILDRLRGIRLSEEHHGPPAGRHFHYEPTWILRGLTKLHLEFEPVR